MIFCFVTILFACTRVEEPKDLEQEVPEQGTGGDENNGDGDGKEDGKEDGEGGEEDGEGDEGNGDEGDENGDGSEGEDGNGNGDGENGDGENNPDSGEGDTGNNGDENYTEELPEWDNYYDGEMANDGWNDFVVSGDAAYWENVSFANVVTVSYYGAYAVVDSSNESLKSFVTNADVSLDLRGFGPTEIIAQGVSEDGQLKIYGDSEVKIVLNDLKLISQKSSAINVQSKADLYIHLNNGTRNLIGDAASQSDESYYLDGVAANDEKRNGAIYSKGSVSVSGSGVLMLSGNKKHGISAKSSFTLRAGATISISDVADNCVKAEGINILGGYIWANTSADAGKCLSSDGDVIIKGGVLKLNTSGGSIYEADENDTSSPAGIKADLDVVIYGGDILCVSSGEGGKGINVDGNLTIYDGVINVLTSGGKYVYNAAQDLDSSPKGVKADGEIVINGGYLNIQVTGKSDGSEGLESKTKLTINDGEVFVYAYDDAINVGGDYPVGIEINGGKVFAFADNNDGIDSNAMMWINGGLVITSGSAAPEEGFDCDHSENFVVTGGILIGTGGAAVATSSSSTQRSVIYNGIEAKTGDLFVVQDSDGNSILMYEFPRTMNRMSVFFSTPQIVSGETYTVFTGGSLNGNTENWNGWCKDGSYTAGSQVGTFTSNGVTTTVGQGGGPGSGGGPGNGGPGNGGWGPGWWD